MAEVRKKVMEDKYNTKGIKKGEIKKTNTVKTKTVEAKKDNNKKGFIDRIVLFFSGVKSEFKRVHWTSKKDMVKYSIATIAFIIFCSGFFYLIDVIFAFIRSLFN